MAGDGAARGPGRPFEPGKSGNPGGRPKTAQQFRARARAAVDEHVIEAWEDEVTNRGPAWLRASELLAAYGYGKPSTIDDENDAPVNPLAGLSTEQILAIAKGETLE